MNAQMSDDERRRIEAGAVIHGTHATKPDILDRLRRYAALRPGDMFPSDLGGPNGWGPPLTAVMNDAIAEIVRLRGLAGAVSDGNDFATIRHVIRRMTDKEAVEAVIGNPR